MTATQICEQFAEALRQHRLPARRVIVALSGGRDSFALLLALSAAQRWRLAAWHVHHGLQADADRFAAICDEQCRRCAVPLDVFHGAVATAGRGGPEQRARDARYRALAAALCPGDVVVLGHHRDDQAETFLQNAFRGAGGRGLRAMPRVAPLGAGFIVRPMLSLSRAAIVALTTDIGTPVADDPHNVDTRFDRVYLRETVLPLVDRRWPDVSARLSAAADHLNNDYRLTVAAARQRLGRAVSHDGSLAIAPLRVLPESATLVLLREWLLLAGRRPPPPARLQALRIMLASPRPDNRASVDGPGYRVALYQRRLYVVPPNDAPQAGSLVPGRPYSLGRQNGRLELVPTAGYGIRLPSAGLRVHFRRGGERLNSGPERPQQCLKEWLRSARVLPWWRDRLPLLSAEDGIVAVGDLWHSVGTDSGDRFRVAWRDAPVIQAI
ncbi:MAG: tRNA lysidine(34) synthetase TilS [Pseudomonadota bacterium]